MSRPWAASLPRENANFLGRLRLVAGIELCQTDSLIWLRGDDLDAIELRLRALPGVTRYDRLADGALTLAGGRVPCETLPDANWQPLVNWLTGTLPPTVWPGDRPQRVAIQLVRTTQHAEPTLLLTNHRDWTAYADHAPQVRLDCWSFAADASGRVLVRGAPLPSLPGVFYVETEGVAVPAGWWWTPAVAASTLRRALGLDVSNASGGTTPDLALFLAEDGTWDLVSGDGFVKATRSAARLTREALHASE